MMMCAAKKPFTLFLYDIVEKGEDGWHGDYFAAKAGYIEECRQPLWNLPFCVDRESQRVVTQTNAIFAHLGRACGMFGDDAAAGSACEQLLCELYDLRNVMTAAVYGAADLDAAAVLASGRRHLLKLEAVLELQARATGAATVVHLVNGKCTAPDFHLYELLDQFRALAEEDGQELYAGLPRLRDFRAGFAALPENQFYLQS